MISLLEETPVALVVFLRGINVGGQASLGAMSNAALLKMWTETTAGAIYPGRRIGQLREGYEASFLVLAGDPLMDFAEVTRITRRVKQGRALP